jgi:lysosomal acid lipase/cholesteryl ester hydrolase
MHNPSVAPAFVLANAGYDVWLGNSRGNKYSHEHINEKIKKKDFWFHSFEKMGEHDLPAAISYVLQMTGQ